jgi:DNA mismatch endonuclease (patch repair protein)
MRGNRSRDTKPELALRHILFGRGLRYRVNYQPLPEDRRFKADIVFPRAKVVVLVDGCFWHGCEQHFHHPKTHVDYWDAKIARNKDRDAQVNGRLEEDGWTVLRFWEHEDAEHAADVVETTVRRRALPQVGDGRDTMEG